MVAAARYRRQSQKDRRGSLKDKKADVHMHLTLSTVIT
jgi:hypothetical protein